MKLVQLAEACDVEGVLRELGALTPDERAAQADALEARRTTLRDGWYNRPEKERGAQLAAELGCRTDPVAAADWIHQEDNHGVLGRRLPLGGTWMLDIVNLHPVAWRAELAARLAEQWEPYSQQEDTAQLIEHLVHDTGCPLPTTDGFIEGWLSSRRPGRQHPAHLRGGVQPGASLLERLRADDLSPKFLPLVLERPGIEFDVHLFHHMWADKSLTHAMENTLLGVFISLSAEGMVDRGALIRRVFSELAATPEQASSAMDVLTVLALTPAERASVSRERTAIAEQLLSQLLQDGPRRQTAPPLAYLRALALTPAENAPALRTHVALLDLSLPVATYAQEVLTGLDEAGLLEPEVLTEVCERVLLRPEKKLVRAQLTRLDRAARKDPARAARTVLDAATAFDHRDVDVQERALNVIARHLGAAGDSVLPELRTAAARISPGLAARAADLFGTGPDHLTEPYADTLPAVPEPRPVPVPIETAAEVAEEVAAVVANDRDVVMFERALDGLVRHAHLDRAALVRALKPVMRQEPAWYTDSTQSDVYDVAAALVGEEPRERHFAARLESLGFSVAGELLAARLAEAIDIIEADAQPFLLAVPTDSTGALDAAALVRRISVLDGLGVTPAPVDLAQALLRVTTTVDEKVLAAAGELRSEAGRRLAQWLHEGGLPHRDSEPENWPGDHPGKSLTDWLRYERPQPTTGPPLLPAAAALLGPYRPSGFSGMLPFWLAQLPHHREVVLTRGDFGYLVFIQNWAPTLPFAAESGGPAGFALHLALVYSLTYEQPVERDAGVDALLVLAARGQLNSDLLGRQLAEVLRAEWNQAHRVTASLRTAAETGAYATVWSVLEAALPHLLRAPVVRGAGPLLALGVDCASRCAAKGEIPAVTAVAAGSASSHVVKNARLLRDVLG
ncbi:DUF6493 family protein [Streptomyces violaceusniger]|uniref:DUF6493 family protein n=1 Tax=Streptomyces violaceusniger TaxID=68280 RepID=UPI0031E04262